MLIEKIYQLPVGKEVNPKKQEALHKEIIRYALNISTAKRLNDAARDCDVFKEVQVLKQSFLKGHGYIMSGFWKALIKLIVPSCDSCQFKVKCKEFGQINPCSGFTPSFKKVSKKFNISRKDLHFALEVLTKTDIRKIKKKYKDREIKEQPFTIDEVFKEVRTWSRRLVWKKFKFVLKYYRDLELEDIVNDLLVEGYLRAMECDTIMDKLLFINTIKRRINQRSDNLFGYYTAERRSRIKFEREPYVEAIKKKAIEKHLDHLPFEEQERRFKNEVQQEFELTVLSLDHEYDSSDEEETTTLHNVVTDEKKSSIEKLDIETKYRNLIRSMPNTVYARIMQIIMGGFDKDFNHYIKNRELTDKQYASKIFEFFNVDKDTFKKEVGDVLVNCGFKM